MILRTHNDASYLSKENPCSSYTGYFLGTSKAMANHKAKWHSIVLVSILKLVAGLASEAELERLFHYDQKMQELWFTLCEKITADVITSIAMKH